MKSPAVRTTRAAGYQIAAGGLAAALLGIVSGIYLWWPNESPAEPTRLAPTVPQGSLARGERMRSPSPFGAVLSEKNKEAMQSDVTVQSGEAAHPNSPPVVSVIVQPVKAADALHEHRP